MTPFRRPLFAGLLLLGAVPALPSLAAAQEPPLQEPVPDGLTDQMLDALSEQRTREAREELIGPSLDRLDAPGPDAEPLPDAATPETPRTRGEQKAADEDAADPERTAAATPVGVAKCPEPPMPAADAAAATAAAQAYMEALKSQGLAAAPAYLHPEALMEFQAGLMPALEQEQARGRRGLLNATFGRDATVVTARSAPADAFMARFVRLMTARQPDLAPGFTSLTPLGVVPEGERLHVLLRLGPDPVRGLGERLDVVSVAKFGADYKVLLDDRLRSMIAALAGRGGGSERRAGLPLAEPIPEGVPLAPLAPPSVNP